MATAWNKGLTKETNTSVRKISRTMKERGVDNFKNWREEQAKGYRELVKNGDLAELIGVVLGDGHIQKFPRTECLRVVGDAQKMQFVYRTAWLIEKVFGKKPAVQKRKASNGVNITIYEKYISKRLGIPTGARGNAHIRVPRWILADRKFVVRYLRGLYEAEGSYSVHKPTYTYKFIFANRNTSLLRIVERLVKQLGFHPHSSATAVQLSRKSEVEKLMNLLHYRRYDE